jgi:hypothetical protein
MGEVGGPGRGAGKALLHGHLRLASLVAAVWGPTAQAAARRKV